MTGSGGGGLPRFRGRAFLAPMAGVSDPALRLLCRRRGAGLVVTEFTSVHAIVARERELRERSRPITDFVEYSDEERPLSVQLFGSDTEALGRAAAIVAPHFDVIDYNMGCPAPHITRQMAGGALLQHEGLTRRILRTLVGAAGGRPVTLKVRAGVTDEGRRAFLRIARAAEDEGVAMITLHPRTVSQGYSGRSDWSLIAELKRAVGVPVVGNGDIGSPEDARDMIERTGCDYVMIGRGAMGNPFIFEQVNDLLSRGSYRAYGAADRIAAFFEYMEAAARFRIRLSSLRTQAMRFSRGMPGASRLRPLVAAARSAGEIESAMRGAAAEAAAAAAGGGASSGADAAARP